MFFALWNSSLLAVAVCVLCLTKGPQPRFHAVIMLITGLLGTQLHKLSAPGAWPVGLGVTVLFNVVTLALSPLQLVLAWCLTPKSPIEPGIAVLHNGDEKGNVTVDIVAVHGLGSNPDWAWTWEDQAKKCMWLKDLLPKSIPRARIMTYNHNSAWFRDAPVKSVKICGEELLEALNTERSQSKEAQQRPIIFIGHSFGGIIIKQALVVASEKYTDATFDSIEKSMHGAIFLGVPHDGSQLTSWGEVLSYCTYWLGSSTELLEALQPGAESLRELNRSFFTNYGQRDLVDFFETQKTKAMGVPVLLGVNTHASTNLGVKRVALVTDHVGMNKFRSETHMNYRLVLGQLTRMVDKIEKEQLKSLSAEQRECLKSLYVVGSDNRRESIEKAHPSTLEWLDDSPVIKEWLRKKSQMVWVSGKPGSGKSSLAKNLLDRLVEQQNEQKEAGTFNYLRGTAALVGFFFNGRGPERLRNESTFLHSLLFQLVEQEPSLSRHVPPRKMDGSSKHAPLPLAALKKALFAMLDDARLESVSMIVDAFDECGEECKQKLLRFLTQDLVNHKSHPRILVTGRRHAELEMFLDAYPTMYLEDFNGNDINTFLASEFETFTRHRSREFVDMIVAKAAARSQGVFLWVTLVVKELKKGKLLVGTDQELERAIDSLPADLTEFYDHILEGLDTTAQAETRRMLEWVLFADRPLSVEEFRCAIFVGSGPPSADLASLEQVALPEGRMEERIREYSGGLLEIKGGIKLKFFTQEASEKLYVQLIHQSVKDYLLEKKTTVAGPTSGELPLIEARDAHAHLARVCIQYLAFADFNLPAPTDMDTRRRLLKIPFVRYATQMWIKHAPLADPSQRTACMTIFGWPAKQNFQTWLTNYEHLEGIGEDSHQPRVGGWKKPLFVASQMGLQSDVKHFIPFLEKEDGNERQASATSALVAASVGGHETTAALVLDTDGESMKGDYGNALHEAARRGHQMNYGEPLRAAACSGHKDAVRMLLEKGANVNAKGGFFGCALQGAAFGGFDDVVGLLLQWGADINEAGGGYGYALHAAAIAGHESTVALLLERGAAIDACGGDYGYALEAAARGYHPIVKENQIAVVKLLLEWGADVNAQGGKFHGKEIHAAAVAARRAAIQWLISHDQEWHAVGGSEGTALQAAAGSGSLSVIKLLLDSGADIACGSNEHQAPLSLAAARGHTEVVEFLLEKGVDVNTEGGDSPSALFGAVDRRKVPIVRILLDHGANSNVKGISRRDVEWAIQVAVSQRCEEIVCLLLERGADPSNVKLHSCTFAEVLEAGSPPDMARLLVEDFKRGRDSMGRR